MECRQCLPLSVVQLKDKHCQKPHCRNGVVDTFGHGLKRLLAAACSLKMPHNFWTKLEIGGHSGVEEKWRNIQEMRKDTKKY